MDNHGTNIMICSTEFHVLRFAVFLYLSTCNIVYLVYTDILVYTFKRLLNKLYGFYIVCIFIGNDEYTMTIKLNSELFQTEAFQASFKEKLKSARYWEYDHLNTFTNIDLKHYQYARAAKGALAEAGLMGYLMLKGIDFVYNKKIDDRKYSPDIDFYIPSTDTKIDVKSGMSFWKEKSLVKYGIDYVVVCSPLLEHKEYVYRKNGYMMLRSYRQLFKDNVTVQLNGFISVNDILNQGPGYELTPLENLF